MLSLSHVTKLETANAPTIRRSLEAFGFFTREIGSTRMLMERIHPEESGSLEQAEVRESLTSENADWIKRVTRVIR